VCRLVCLCMHRRLVCTCWCASMVRIGEGARISTVWLATSARGESSCPPSVSRPRSAVPRACAAAAGAGALGAGCSWAATALSIEAGLRVAGQQTAAAAADPSTARARSCAAGGGKFTAANERACASLAPAASASHLDGGGGRVSNSRWTGPVAWPRVGRPR
jgi:hypothetical protein